MKLIMLMPEMPFPANTGGRILVAKRLEYLSKNNEIYLFCIVDGEKDFLFKKELEKFCKEVHLYDRSKVKIQNMFKSLFIGPYACASRTYKKLKDDIDLCFDKIQPEFVIVEFPQMLGNISPKILKQKKVILEQHNIEYLTMHNLGCCQTGLKKRIFLFEANRLKKYEEKFYKKDEVLLYTFVSSSDKEFFEKKYHLMNTYLFPIGAEVFSKKPLENLPNNIMYFGKMSYPPNVDGALWFAKNVFQKVKENVPNVQFYIVGKDPDEKLLDLPKIDKDIIVTGTVESVDEYYDKAKLVIIPLGFGGGVKVKLLEALGRGNLVLTTAKGLEGTILNPIKMS